MKNIFHGLSRLWQCLHSASYNHRHLVVGPLFVLLFLSSVLPRSPLVSLSQERPVGHMTVEDETYVPIDSHGGMILLSGGVAEPREDGVWELIDGAAVVYGSEWVTIAFRDSFVRGYNGAFYVIATGDHLTIAALTSPVLLIQGEDHMIIPVETQWRTEGSLEFKEWETWTTQREVQLLPLEFFQGHAAHVHSLEDHFSHDMQSGEEGNTNMLDFIHEFVLDVDGWLMASFHPNLRERAWVVGMPEHVGSHDIPLRLLLFPISDVLQKKINTFTVERWMRELRQFLDREHDPGPFFNMLIKRLSDLVNFADDHVYPERSEQYREILRSLTQSHGYLLTRSSHAMLEAMQTRDTHLTFTAPEEESARSSPVKSEELSQSFDPAAVETGVYDALRTVGALFTVQTKIGALSPEKATVEGIMFGDSIFSFVYDLSEGSVNQIVRDDQSLPYTVSLAEFTEWAKSGQ